MWPLKKVEIFQNEKWIHMGASDNLLKIDEDVLYIFSKDIIIYSLHLFSEMKGYTKENTLIIAFEKEGLKKVKMTFGKKFKKMKDITRIFALHFPIHQIPNKPINDAVPGTSTQASQMDHQESFKTELKNQMGSYENGAYTFPPDFPLEQFINDCLADPSFPYMVEQIEQCLQKRLK